MSSPLLALRDGRLLLSGQALSFAAHGIAAVALPWLVLENGGSTGAAGLVFTLTTLPYVVFGLLAGVVGDRFQQRRTIWVSHAVQALVALLVPLWTLWGAPPVGLVLAAAFAIGAGRVFADAAVFGVIVAVVGKSRIVEGQATLGAAWAVGLVAGPALGGVLITLVGPARALVFESAGLVLAALAIRALRTAGSASETRRRPVEIVRAGLSTIFGDPVLRSVTFLGLAWSVAAAGAWALAVPFLREELGLSSRTAGAVVAAGGLMGVLAPPIVGALDRRIGGLRILVRGIPVAALATAMFGLSEGLALALAGFCLLELATVVTTAAYIGERQRRAPLALQATVGIFGRMLIMLALTTGSAAAAALAGAIPLRSLYVGMAVAMLASGLVAAPTILRHARAVALPAHGR